MQDGCSNIYKENAFEGGDLVLQDMQLQEFANLLCEFSKYNSDLKAILKNSKLSTGQNQNQDFAPKYDANQDDDLKTPFNLDSFQKNHESSEKFITPKKDPKESECVIISNSVEINNPMTRQSVYNLLNSRGTILVNASKLSEKTREIVKNLVSNGDSNNQDSQLISNASQIVSVPDDQNNIVVRLNADQFHDLIYYSIIKAVMVSPLFKQAQGNKQVQKNNDYNNNNINMLYHSLMPISAKMPNIGQSVNNGFAAGNIENIKKDMKQYIENIKKDMKWYVDNNDSEAAYNLYTSYRDSVNKIENVNRLKQFIDAKRKENGPNGFWGSFLLDVVKRDSFFISLYHLCKSSSRDRRKYLIDTVLSAFSILSLFSVIFGWGSIICTTLTIISFLKLVYKAITQYKQERPQYLMLSLLRTPIFEKMSNDLGGTVVMDTALLLRFYNQLINQQSGSKQHPPQLAENATPMPTQEPYYAPQSDVAQVLNVPDIQDSNNIYPNL